MSGLACGWVSATGAVRFTVANLTPGYTVKRVTPGHTVQTVRGYATDDWWVNAASVGYDYEMELGVKVGYAEVPVAAATLPAGTPVVDVFTQTPGRANGEAWLRDILQPILSQPVSIMSTNQETRAARQATYDIVGRPNPVVVWDSRTSRQGTINLAVQNHPQTGVWDDNTVRDRMDKLLSTGRPLLLSMCANLGFHPCYMAVANAGYTRIGDGATWELSLDYVEVDNPISLGVYPVAEVTYTIAQSIPPDAVYNDWTPVTYYDIATRTTA